MPGYRSIPDSVSDAIAKLDADAFVVCCAQTAGEGATVGANSWVPEEHSGRWARWNINGRSVPLKDLPKIEKIVGFWETPVFGDYSKGSVTHARVRPVYQRRLLHGKQLALRSDTNIAKGRMKQYTQVDCVFPARGWDPDELLLACSLLREQTGAHAQVRASHVPLADWVASELVDWELLPPGQAVQRLEESLQSDVDPKTVTAKARQVRADHVRLITALGPSDTLRGTTGWRRYIAFRFTDSLVVLENQQYGNATYVMYADWERLSKLSRQELLSMTNVDFDRVIHNGRWHERLSSLLAGHGWEKPG